MDENALVEILKVRLAPRYQKILLHQNLATLTQFRTLLVNQLGYLPVLNEIDMILVRNGGQLCAIEVKYFKVEKGSFNRPFYDGIGQALSLLRYGFDYVALWHLFSGEIEQNRLDRYGAGTWWFLHNQTNLPLDFTYFRVDVRQGNPEFMVMKYDGPDRGAQLRPIDSKDFVITWAKQNPFRFTKDGMLLRKTLADALKIGDLVR